MTDTQLTDIALTKLDGTPTTLAELAGGAVLVVNVASKCGLTPQYSALEKLAKDYGDRGLTVIGVPCNQFMGQEPGTAEEIQTFFSGSGSSYVIGKAVNTEDEDWDVKIRTSAA